MLEMYYFSADWCQPCKTISPIVIGTAAAASIKLTKIDVDKQGDIAQRYNVSGVPTVIFFVNGQPGSIMQGTKITRKALEDTIRQYGIRV